MKKGVKQRKTASKKREESPSVYQPRQSTVNQLAPHPPVKEKRVAEDPVKAIAKNKLQAAPQSQHLQQKQLVTRKKALRHRKMERNKSVGSSGTHRHSALFDIYEKASVDFCKDSRTNFIGSNKRHKNEQCHCLIMSYCYHAHFVFTCYSMHCMVLCAVQ